MNFRRPRRPPSTRLTCAPRVRIPDSLAGICSTDKYDRVAHCYGQSTADLARMFARDFSNPPDTVAFPRNEPEVADLLDWCGGNGIAAAPGEQHRVTRREKQRGVRGEPSRRLGIEIASACG